MTTEEFKALKPLEGRRVRIVFTDGHEVIARLFDVTTDMDDSQHLIYEQVEWSSHQHADNSKGAFYASGEELLRVSLLEDADA
jgi:hypothetical protein